MLSSDENTEWKTPSAILCNTSAPMEGDLCQYSYQLYSYHCVICQQRQKVVQTSRYQQRSSCRSSARTHTVIWTWCSKHQPRSCKYSATSVQVCAQIFRPPPLYFRPQMQSVQSWLALVEGSLLLLLSGENLTWNESTEFCQQHNSSLVVSQDPAEMVTRISR